MTVTSARIEVFRPGTFRPMAGDPVSYTADDLRAIASGYDPEAAPAPIVVGHPKTDAPAFGWASGFEFDEPSQRLMATIGDVEPTFAEAVKAGRYRKVSMSFYRPDAANNPKPGSWYPKHIGFLGGAAPAVSGLKPISFTDDDAQAATFEFGEPGFEHAASLFRGLRDWMIDRFGLDDTDKVLPVYKIEWLYDTEIEPRGRVPAFSEPIPAKEEPEVTKPNDAEFADREAEIAAREKRLADRERQLRHDDNVAFAETLITEGRMIPASKDKLVSLLDAAPDEATVSFAGGQDVSLAEAVRAILKDQPKVVSFGEYDLGDDPESEEAAAVSFSSDGKRVDAGRLAIHNKALAYQRAHPGTDYASAVDAVS